LFYRPINLFIIALIGIISLQSCATITYNKKIQKRKVYLHIKTDKNLNFYDGSPHELPVYILQIKDKESFDKKYKTFFKENKPFYRRFRKDTNIVSKQEYSIKPAHTSTKHFIIEIEHSAKYIVILANYFKPQFRVFCLSRQQYDVWPLVAIDKLNNILYSSISPINIELLLDAQCIKNCELIFPKKCYSTPILRIHGSNTIGSILMPEIAKQYLKKIGARNVKIFSKNDGLVKIIVGDFPDTTSKHIEKNIAKSIEKSIEIESYGTSTGFTSIGKGYCDIVMASRKINNNELMDLNFLGMFDTPYSEKVLALDAIAIIVNQNNPLKGLTVNNLKKIFNGRLFWTDLIPYFNNSITIYRLDDNSGTTDMFNKIVMSENSSTSSKYKHIPRVFVDNFDLSEAVYNDNSSIGYISYAFREKNKCLKIGYNKKFEILPNYSSISGEEYPLTRRLYLYSPAKISTIHIRDFLNFALSEEAQTIIHESGFVDLTVKEQVVPVNENAPEQFKSLVKNAIKINITFRFKNSQKLCNNQILILDSKGVQDIGRLACYLQKKYTQNQYFKTLLIGFTHNYGAKKDLKKYSQSFSKHVKSELFKYGIKSNAYGFGGARLISPFYIRRDINNRVEVWLKKM